MIVIFILIIAAIFIFKLPHLINNKMWSDLFAFSVFMAIGLFVSFALIFEVDIPNPTHLLVKIFGFMKWLVLLQNICGILCVHSPPPAGNGHIRFRMLSKLDIREATCKALQQFNTRMEKI